MESINVFFDKQIINVIPFFTALYLSYYKSMVIIPLFLTLCVIVFYLFTNLLSNRILKQGKQYKNKRDLENNIYDELVKENYKKINAWFSLTHWILIAITAIILYQYKTEPIAFLLFWYLIVGFSYNIISIIILNIDRIKTEFKR